MRHLTIRLAALAVTALALLAPPAAGQVPGAREDKALGRAATASSVEQQRGGTCRDGVCTPDRANDGRADTRWGSAFADGQFWQVDLGGPRAVDTVFVEWEEAYAAAYEIATSLDGATFTRVAGVTLPPGLVSDRVPVETAFEPRAARFVRVTGLRRATRWGFSIWTVAVFGPDDATFPGLAPPAAAPPPPAPAPPPVSAPRAVAPRLIAGTEVRLRGRTTRSGAVIDLLSVRAPRSATVRVRCEGRGCPRRVRARRGSGRFAQLRGSLRAGAVIEVFITRRGALGRYTRFRIRRRLAPQRTDRCLRVGTRTPTACPAAT